MRRSVLLRACFLLAAFAAGAAQAQIIQEDRTREKKSDWELEQEKRDWKEGDLKLPAFPKDGDLVEFTVAAVHTFRFYIDSASLAPGADGVVRYTLVARSPAGVSNISYEGIRCASSTWKMYALGSDGRWAERQSEWREIESRAVQRWHLELRHRYFCPNRIPIFTAAEGLDALRRGGHPAVFGKTYTGR